MDNKSTMSEKCVPNRKISNLADLVLNNDRKYWISSKITYKIAKPDYVNYNKIL